MGMGGIDLGRIRPKETTTSRSGFSAASASRDTCDFGDSGWNTSIPRSTAARLIGEGVSARPRPAGRSGWVYTATTSLRRAAAISEGTAKSGVPAKTSLMGVGIGDWGLGIREKRKRGNPRRSEEHTSELQSLMRISYDVFCLNKKKHKHKCYKIYN